jgi:hypothetical protein
MYRKGEDGEMTSLYTRWRIIPQEGPSSGDKIRHGTQKYLKLPEEGLEEKKMSNSSPLLEATVSRNPSKNMSANQLLTQKSDVPLKRLVQRLYLDLAVNDAWYKFLAHKGATGTEQAEQHILKARQTEEPERTLIPEFCKLADYMAIDFLEDLRTIPEVADTTAAILMHLATVESAAQTAAEAAIRLNGELRNFITENKLQADLSLPAVESTLRLFKQFGIGSLNDLKKMDEQKFVRCGMHGLYATKAVEAAQRLPASK